MTNSGPIKENETTQTLVAGGTPHTVESSTAVEPESPSNAFEQTISCEPAEPEPFVEASTEQIHPEPSPSTTDRTCTVPRAEHHHKHEPRHSFWLTSDQQGLVAKIERETQDTHRRLLQKSLLGV